MRDALNLLRSLASLALLGALACGPQLTPLDDGTNVTTQGETDDAPPPGRTSGPVPPSTTTSTSTTTANPTSADGTGDESAGTSGPHPDHPRVTKCDLFDQDCPRGDKCMPWSNDGSNEWNAMRCSPVADDPAAPGEACLALDSPYSGFDDCDDTSMCWYVDAGTLEGTCVPFCEGSIELPTCANPDRNCLFPDNEITTVCLPTCDPLFFDCAAGQVCAPNDGTFLCMADASGPTGAEGDTCEAVNGCDPGQACIEGVDVPDCRGDTCCAPFCDLSEPMPMCPLGQVCTPYFERGTMPGVDYTGICRLP
ncbi:MAG: hypothetical protein K0V04_24560 [Deltaproteobacteria bacterium]|nr:hypothetical protein [Deltaproteobacteria bacterium]